jgi:hypothetical protein
VLYLRLIIFSVGDDVPVDSDAFLVTDFMDLKIKSAQSFKVTYRGRVCVRVFIEVSAHPCISTTAQYNTHIRTSTHFYEHTHIQLTPINTSERLS